MSAEENDLYRVLYTGANGREQLTEAMPYGAAQSRARDLQGQGIAVGSVMGDVAARGYMHARHAPTYRGVGIPLDLRGNGIPRSALEAWKQGVDAELDGAAPKPADADPFAPDLTMSRDVADFILRAVNGLVLEGYWPKAYTVDGRHGDDDRDYDDALLLKAADIVGRDKIVNRYLQRFIAGLDSDDGSTT